MARTPSVQAKTAANSPTTVYLSTFNSNPACTKDREKIARKCKPEDAQSEEDKKDGHAPKRKGLMANVNKITTRLDTLGRTATQYKRNANNAWIDTHCDGMWYKPSGLKEASQEIKDTVTSSVEALKGDKWGLIQSALLELRELAVEKAGDAAKRKVIGLAGRSLLKNLLGGAAVVGTLGTAGTAVEAGMVVWTVTDVIETATELAAMAGPEGAAVLAALLESVNIHEKADAMLREFVNNPDNALAETMATLSRLNPCLHARRCQLVRMKDTTPAKDAAKKGTGCCPGQTGHHLLPREMFVRKIKVDSGQLNANGKPKMKSVPDPSNCEAYTDAVHDNAPVVCVEGTSNKAGSHGAIHKSIDKMMNQHRATVPGDTITHDQAINYAVLSHNQTFKPPCDPNCLRAQLHSFYDDLCKGKLKPRGGAGTSVEQTDAPSQDNV